MKLHNNILNRMKISHIVKQDTLKEVYNMRPQDSTALQSNKESRSKFTKNSRIFKYKEYIDGQNSPTNFQFSNVKENPNSSPPYYSNILDAKSINSESQGRNYYANDNGVSQISYYQNLREYRPASAIVSSEYKNLSTNQSLNSNFVRSSIREIADNAQTRNKTPVKFTYHSPPQVSNYHPKVYVQETPHLSMPYVPISPKTFPKNSYNQFRNDQYKKAQIQIPNFTQTPSEAQRLSRLSYTTQNKKLRYQSPHTIKQTNPIIATNSHFVPQQKNIQNKNLATNFPNQNIMKPVVISNLSYPPAQINILSPKNNNSIQFLNNFPAPKTIQTHITIQQPIMHRQIQQVRVMQPQPIYISNIPFQYSPINNPLYRTPQNYQTYKFVRDEQFYQKQPQIVYTNQNSRKLSGLNEDKIYHESRAQYGQSQVKLSLNQNHNIKIQPSKSKLRVSAISTVTQNISLLDKKQNLQQIKLSQQKIYNVPSSKKPLPDIQMNSKINRIDTLAERVNVLTIKKPKQDSIYETWSIKSQDQQKNLSIDEIDKFDHVYKVPIIDKNLQKQLEENRKLKQTKKVDRALSAPEISPQGAVAIGSLRYLDLLVILTLIFFGAGLILYQVFK